MHLYGKKGFYEETWRQRKSSIRETRHMQIPLFFSFFLKLRDFALHMINYFCMKWCFYSLQLLLLKLCYSLQKVIQKQSKKICHTKTIRPKNKQSASIDS